MAQYSVGKKNSTNILEMFLAFPSNITNAGLFITKVDPQFTCHLNKTEEQKFYSPTNLKLNTK